MQYQGVLTKHLLNFFASLALLSVKFFFFCEEYEVELGHIFSPFNVFLRDLCFFSVFFVVSLEFFWALM